MPSSVPRRTFLSAAGVTIASVVGSRLPAQPAAPKPDPKRKAVGTRQSVAQMGDDHPVLVSYRKAISAMRKLKPDNPLSWQFQANMHDAGRNGADAAWKWCQHGNWWFLPWHRGYLYYFERIIRALSGDEKFMLPYWAWEKPRQNVLPAPFRSAKVGGDPNPLYDETRALANRGQALRPSRFGTFVGDWESAQRASRFTTGAAETSFGGIRRPAVKLPARPESTGSHGVMEAQAHDLLHVAVGAGGGNMGRTSTAAQDPIFWLHHANVDRLWNRWLDGRGHDLPDETADADWYSQQFPFYDEAGKRVTPSVKEILGIAAEGYVYDEELKPRVFGEAVPAAKEGKMATTEVSVGAIAPSLKLGTTAFTQPLRLTDEGKPKVVKAFGAAPGVAEPPVLVLRVEGIQPPADADLMFEVFVTKKGDKPSEDTYVGPITFFGRGGDGHAHGGKDGFTQGFDVTAVVERLRTGNKNELPELEVTILPVSTLGLSADELAKKKLEVPIKDVTLQLVTEEKK